ncbi:uncharacterized protein LOC115768234 [Drosophila novamexicana]|uniref:uncharacterized protein LOC115768234 n=1 Tax=Drosophila novamexicana TaxID=47314 RepID=UPI0011E5C07F|nr:uncharacterized protein LOC115768234 [Drosophila novamexicana]XP_030568630.1 uncharacterized protein LOC115768234 [Drosophila novamexicana]
MSAVVCEFIFKLFIAYLCFLNLANITAKRAFTLTSQYKKFLGIPYGTEQILEIHEREYEYTLPAIAAILACMGCDAIHSLCFLFVSEELQHRLWHLMTKLFWISKSLWLFLYIAGFTSILRSHHELYLITHGLQLENVDDLLISFKFQFVWQTVVFIFAIICWMEEDTLTKNYYKLLLYERDYQI